ncbi:hypothetical protein EPUS_03667 [Endocarpon pusillum Z07020]|uniref:ATPase AAA-type core domain-containing protein n=1 Tax=Endocarpon pusillum (strain Z07020 / HMAS-L-300199) TaxID=1263415 RepID=U1HHP8_ENDPU|nr:uncharacterized protein EPUS_03667 [Endocarpon pusillum Z07020]ERF69675.1 hypothetical protein EPUS_03667 [Endocarpon pusillum Z07020]
MSSQSNIEDSDAGQVSTTESKPESTSYHTAEGEQPQSESITREASDSSIWDFRVPSLTPPVTFQPGGVDGCASFSIRDLIAAIQNGMSHEDVKTYMSHYNHSNPQLVSRSINDTIEGIPAMFYVIAANNDASIRLFAKFGGDVGATYGSPPVPLLAFAIINGKINEQDTTAAVATLLSLGADGFTIPKPFYCPFDEELPSEGPPDASWKEAWEAEKTLWCQPPSIQKLLTEAINITQRYYLHRSSKLTKPTERQRWVAARHDSTELFAVPYFLIGQSAATNLLTRNFLHYMLRRHDQPLVLVFAGPSGHGKTELARRLGALLSLELQISDCTIVSREVELFGPRKPYVGADEGAPLNNFLAANNGRRCIVFLDEFEKTTADIWNALLIPFDKGEYQDRRNLKTVNCSKTIWILATNALDKKIIDFCDRNEAIFDEDNSTKREKLLEELTSAMRDDFMSVFKPPLTGRISAFVPFLPFSRSETCVGAHKYLLELTNEVLRPINTKPGPEEQLLGNIRLKIRSDVSVCKVVVKDYDPELGIRSLKKAVRDRVASLLDIEYMSMHEVISEGLPMEDYSVFVSDGRVRVKSVGMPQTSQPSVLSDR